MAQASTYPYCNLTTDLQMAFTDVEKFSIEDTLETWTLNSGSTYEKRNTGFYGAVWQNGSALTEKTSIATVEATVSTFWYDSTNDILYVHMDDGADPDTADVVTASLDTWNEIKTLARNDAQEAMEAMLDPQYPRPIPFSQTSYNTRKYDFDIRYACALLTVYFIVSRRDPKSSVAKELYDRVWNPEEDSGLLWEYYTHRKSFSFETTKDEFLGNVEVILIDSTSTARMFIAGNPYSSQRRQYRVKITTGGVAETAKFQFSDDGGLNYSAADSWTTYGNWSYLVNDIWIRFEGTMVANDEWEIIVGDKDLEHVKSNIGAMDIKVF